MLVEGRAKTASTRWCRNDINTETEEQKRRRAPVHSRAVVDSFLSFLSLSNETPRMFACVVCVCVCVFVCFAF